MSKFTTYANDILDMEYGGWAAAGYTAGTTSIVRLGGTSYTYPIMVVLTSTLSVAATPGTEFVNAGGSTYARLSLATGPVFATTGASAQSKTNAAAATFTNCPATTWADVYTADSTGTPKPMNFKGTPSLAKTVNLGDTCVIPIDNFTGNEI
ncbi:MAG TPA: hypothetical protein VGL39_27855 [Jatrophihabitantaceae bacterium]|jgi:hypothetical protein